MAGWEAHATPARAVSLAAPQAAQAAAQPTAHRGRGWLASPPVGQLAWLGLGLGLGLGVGFGLGFGFGFGFGLGLGQLAEHEVGRGAEAAHQLRLRLGLGVRGQG